MSRSDLVVYLPETYVSSDEIGASDSKAQVTYTYSKIKSPKIKEKSKVAQAAHFWLIYGDSNLESRLVEEYAETL